MGHISHLLIKCLGTVILLIVTVAFGIIPIRFLRVAKSKNVRGRKASRMKMFIGCCNCFAGGVFFSICLLDLLPEVRDKMVSALEEVNIYTTYPLGESIASLGFILMVLTEVLVHTLGKGTMLMDHTHSHDGLDEEEEPLINEQQRSNYGSHHHHCYHEKRQSKCLKVVGRSEDENIPTSSSCSSSNCHGPLNLPTDLTKCVEQDCERSTPIFEDAAPERSITPHLRRSKSLHSISSVNTVVHSSFRMYILIIALSLHSLFEGISVGLITDVNTLIQLLIALVLHKSVLSFALGVKLIDGGLKPRFIIKGIIVFAAMAPIGVGLGLAVLSSFSRVANLFCSGILQGLATGSFLYVTFFEILPEEFTFQSRNKVQKILSMMFGFLLIAGMCYYEHRFKHKMKKVAPKSMPENLLPSTVETLFQS